MEKSWAAEYFKKIRRGCDKKMFSWIRTQILANVSAPNEGLLIDDVTQNSNYYPPPGATYWTIINLELSIFFMYSPQEIRVKKKSNAGISFHNLLDYSVTSFVNVSWILKDTFQTLETITEVVIHDVFQY